MPLPIELTLVLAATRSMGIGLGGTLPWTGLRKEMAYFARVTKRLPAEAPPTAQNAVIMGRKTWDSIPAQFRPLKGRLNIVISRSHPDTTPPPSATTDVIRVSSLDQALQHLHTQQQQQALGKVFVIGGAQVYGAALERAETRRVLLTRVMRDFECDVFFPLVFSEGEGEGSVDDKGNGWARRSKGEFDAWTGETVPEGVQEEGGTQYEFQMWERVD